MKTTLTRLFTVMMLIMVSMGAKADVKVLFGEKGESTFKNDAGTIEVKQDVSKKDATKITVYLIVTPNKGYSMKEKDAIEAYATAPANINPTRAPQASEKLTLDCDNFKDEYSTRTYHVDIDSNLALWVKSADFTKKESGAKATTGWNGEGYYYIINRGLPEGSDWYLKPATAYYQDNTETPFLTTNTTGQVAGSLWIITLKDGYRQVIHAEDGKYVTTNGYVLSNNKHRKRIHLEKKSTPGDDNDFVFDPNGDYFNISHKTMSEGDNKYWNPSGNNQTYDDGGNSSGNFSGIVGLFNGTTGGSLWELVFVKKCVTPKITVEEENVTITSLTSEAAIYYTDDDSDPATSETKKRYNAAFSLGSATKIRAIATKTGFDNSDEATYSSTRCKTPTIILNKENGLITITPHTDNSGAFIYYTTNGSTPTVSPENKYTEPFILSVDATIIKAIAAFTADGSDASDEAEQTLTQLAPPTFTKNGATITINKPTKDTDGTDLEGPTAVEIRYNLSDTDPTSSSDLYTSSIAMEEDFNSKIVKARAFKSGYIKSEVASLNIDQCAKPTLVNNFDGTVTMTCATSGATIRYTIGASNVGNPTKSSTNYSENQLSLDENNTYTTIKVRAFLAGYRISDVLSYSIPLCPAPYFSENGETVKINCSLADAKIYYRTSSSGDWTEYNNESITPGDYLEAYAGHKGYVKSGGVVYVAATTISSPSEITNMSGSYILSSTFSGTIGTSDNPFTGTLDGQLQKITITAPIVAYADGATIKNIIVELGGNLSTGSTAGHVGAIVCEAKGNSRIYNCGVLPSGSNTISGTGNVGGIVGNLDGNSHVVNCYSFATISGGNNVGGIVGNNTKQTKRTNISSMVLNSTMVMNCMFYGNISGGTKVSPIYGGETIVNDETNGLNNFNYFRQDASINGTAIVYNCALAMEERYLERVEFFRNLLNSNRELAAIYATGDASKGQGVGAACEMAKWVLDKSIAPYPILKEQGQYTSIINFDKTVQAGQDKLKINLLGTSVDVPITSKDPEHFNYNYRMAQLPYYNDYATDNYKNNQVVTGWEISVTGKSGHTYDAYEENNYANPNCITKYAGRVFSQGAYFDVPDEVTEITITPHWAQCVYLSDASYDATGYSVNGAVNNLKQVTQLPRYTNGTAYNINGSSQVVYTHWANAIANLPSGSTSVYDRAIVLVGNYHNSALPPTSGRPFTIMSADLNHDNEPDYSLIYHHTARNAIMPIRFDFLNIPGTSLAQKVNGTGNIKIAAVMKPMGWFEVTNTCLIRFSQFEHDSSSKTTDGAPVILLGGIYEQLIASHTGEAKQTSYIHLGSNAWVKEFSDGSHVKNGNKTKHAPISITGGQYDKFYLSGMYRPDVSSDANNHARCYINGGEFTELAGAGQEQIDGNVTWQICNAHITNFYGGGINANKPITGNITITLKGGRIETFCGGPKFGNMKPGKKVTTTANGTTFGTFFGAGYGGTSLYRDQIADLTYNSSKGYNPGKTQWNTWANNYDKGKYVSGKGIAANFEYEFIDGSEDYTVARLFVNYASFSLAETNDVESTLNDCIIEQNFYGGGNLGKVNGTATSTLNGCEVRGNVYGAGYSAAVPWVDLMNDNNFVGEIYPKYDTSAGVYNNETVLKEGLPGTTRYTWSSKGSVLNNSTTGSLTQDDDGLWIHTDESLTSLGTVQAVVLNIDKVATYGSSDLQGNVYGGGEASSVGGDVTVRMYGGTVTNDVYGGGKGQTTVVGGNVTVNIGDKKEDTGALSGTGTVTGNVYGGSALGAVNAKKESGSVVYSGTDAAPTVTGVNIYAGTVSGSVYGGGLGQTAPSEVAAQNFGNTTVTMEGGTVSTAVYGGANSNGVLKGNAIVNITGGTVNSVPASGDPVDVVFGGGQGQPTLVEGNVEVNIGVETATAGEYTGNAIINGNVYGGSALGNVNAKKSGDDTVYSGGSEYTHVNLNKGTVNGSVYGGGLGRLGDDPVAADVFGPVVVTVNGGKAYNVFGCNNKNGTPKNTVVVTVNGTDATVTNEGVKTYALQGVYGGGNLAHYDPTTPGNYPTVTVSGCDTSIKDVFGGGNAAAVPYTNVTINGGDIDRVFAGGNGESGTAANVGYKNSDATPSSGSYGAGKTNATIAGGTINEIYGGSNSKGTVRASGTLSIAKPSTGTCPMKIGSVYGGGNQAPGAAVTLSIGCTGTTEEDTGITNVFGGANAANISGDILLNITEGKVANVYGGNNSSGSISGTITVNIEKAADACTWYVGNVYGGGKDAAYGEANANKGNYPVVNIKNGTVSGNVYGGGYGSTAIVYGNPQVTIGDATVGYDADVTGDVYGGGDAAAVVGTPVVHVINKDNTSIGNVYGGGNAADVSATSVTIDGGTIGMVFGGGHGDKTTNPQKEANVTGNVGVTIYGGTIAQVFGGSNSKGNIGGTITLDINKSSATGASAMKIGEVYGGGNEAAGNAGTITIGCTGTWTTAADDADNNHDNHDNSTHRIGYELEGIGTVYGGANQANVGNDITLNITGGIIENAFGGNNTSGAIDGDITVNVEWSGTSCSNYLGNVYGGGNLAVYSQKTAGHPAVNIKNGTVSGNVYGGGKGDPTDAEKGVVTGNPVVTIGDATATHCAIVSGDVYGGGDAAAVTGNTTVTYNDANTLSQVANLFGGGNAAGVSGTSTVTLTNGMVTDGIYGGCNSSGSVGAVTIALNGGQVGANTDASTRADVYGGGLGSSTTTTGNIGITLGTDATTGTTVYGDIYGGSALGSVNASASNTTTVTLTSATLHGSVFGGGKGHNDDPNDDNDQDVTATSEGKAIVNINVYDANLTGIYGGANVRGLVKGDIEVNINANVGASGNGNSRNIFGGGYGAATNTNGNVTVTIGDAAGTYQPVVYGDIYGGSALGNVNDAAADKTTVNFLNGTLHGNIYGGGLGDAQNAAKVKGEVEVNIGTSTQTDAQCHIDLTAASIFGCNNTNGSPQDNVTVNIYKTAHTSDNGVSSGTGYAIDQVFGGGNRADYAPENGSANSSKKATVNVIGCENTIRRVFGGGNAAAAVGVVTRIDAGRFDYVYGGGNGEVTAANIGAGGTNLQVHGGQINHLFGGSNEQGSINGNMGVTVDNSCDCDGSGGTSQYADEFFCGNNLASIGTAQNPVTINATIACGTRFGAVYGGCNLAPLYGSVILTVEGGQMDYVYGGSKGRLADNSDPTNPIAAVAADISGDVTLTIKGGQIKNVFGGSNINGNIEGSIEVNIEKDDASTCNDGWYVGNVYGASNLAEYRPTVEGSTLKVNIKNGTVSGNVYGGGKGASATVISNPVVTIGDVTNEDYVAIVADEEGDKDVANNNLVGGNVFGGGDAAPVVGSTTVTYNDNNANTTVANIYGGGNDASVSGNATVNLRGKATVEGDVFGGGNRGVVGGSATVNIE